MHKAPFFAVLATFLCIQVSFGQEKAGTKTALPDSSSTARVIEIKAYAPDSILKSDTLPIHHGDSIFIFDGELYYRARSGEKEFFISQKELMPHSDSLVIYQNLRLINKSSQGGTADTVTQKVVRQRCTALTKDGSRCKRLAMAGKTKCWQHIDQ